MNGAQLLIQALENEGVQHIFGLPGEEIRDIMVALHESSIQFVMTRHEQGAAFMADVYGRLTGKAGVCLSTLGPGATNLLTGISDAHLDHSPVVAITGQGSLARLYQESHQVIDVVRMFGPVSKWSERITHANSIPEMVRKAFKLAEREKPGVTHLELPEDVAAMALEREVSLLKKTIVRRPGPDSKAIQQAIELINASKKPLILAGNGAIRKRASKVLREWVGQTHIPVVSTFMGKGAISDRDPQSLLTLGLGAHPDVFKVLAAADLVITVGYDIAEYGPERWNADRHLKLIHLDFKEAEVYEEYIPEVEIVGDISNSLREMAGHVQKSFDFQEAGEYRRKIEQRMSERSEPNNLKPETILLVLRELMKDDDILISDVGSHKMWVGAKFPTYEPNTVLISNGFATMGIALPGAIGAKLACPEKRVVSINGDGGFLMNVQELETATRLKLKFPVLIFNDESYSLIEEKFRKDHAATAALTFKNPDFLTLAKAFGIHGIRIEKPEELKSGLAHALNCDQICLVDIHIDQEGNQELFNQE